MTMLSLKELCFNVVIDNQGPMVRFASEQLINLPSGLKNDLINKSFLKYENGSKNASTDDDLCVFASMLLHADLVKVQLPNLATISEPETNFCRLMQSCKNFFGFAKDKPKFQLLLEAIVAECPRLELLKINLQYQYIKCPRLEEALFSVLPRLHSLHTLRLSEYCCGDLVLQQISRHCVNLVELEVFIGCEVTTAAFEALSELRHLRYFLFNEGLWEMGAAELTLLCSEFLPLLRVVGSRLNVLDYNLFDHNILARQNQKPKILSLHELHVYSGKNPAANIQLPELQAMILTEPKGALEMVQRFPTITALGLNELGYHYSDHQEEDNGYQLELLMPILQSVGCRLRCLALSEVVRDQVLSLHEVLELCPNLERLSVSNYIFNDTSDVWPEKYVSCLEEAHVGFNKCLTPMGIQRGHPRGFIFQLLLNAPLKKVSIYDSHVSMREIDQLVRLVSEKRILQNVVYFLWYGMSEKLFSTLKAVSPNAEIVRQSPARW